MITRLFIFVFLISSSQLIAQKEANIWYFGGNSGLDFNSGAPVVLTDGQLNTDEGCAVISDKNGSLLFYTDGSTVWNSNHSIMQNGTGLKGNSTSTNSAIIVPKPDYPSIYYIFTVDAEGDVDGLQYSEVDMTLDGSLGGVTSNKNILLFTPTTEQVTAIKNPLSNSYWVVSHKSQTNEFIAYKVSSVGVNTTPVVSALGGTVNNDFLGAMKISPNGRKLASATKIGGRLGLCDFDPVTGKVTNLMDLGVNAYGVEFSPNSKLLYTCNWSEFELSQFDITSNNEADIINSRIIVIADDKFGYALGALQLAPDGKIYMARNWYSYLDVVKSPNTLGLGCDFEKDAVYLDGKESKLGLPPFIQSFFNISTFDVENTCLGDTTKFILTDTVDSVVWDFGDLASGVNNTSVEFEPTHIFSAPGIYEVSVTATVGSESATETVTMEIHDRPIANKPQDLLVCDTNNDGFYSFYLTQQNSAILNGQDSNIFEVIYYASIDDYNNNQPIADPLIYSNNTAYTQETIIVSVKNKNNASCEATTSFKIQVFETPTPNQSVTKLALCDNTSVGTDTDNRIEFDLTQKTTDILNGQLASDFEISYHTDASFTNKITNPTAYQNTSSPQTIYIQVKNKVNANCVVRTSFIIEVLELPIINTLVTLKQCDNDIDGFSDFNLKEVIPKITANAANETITFHETKNEAIASNNAIENVTSYTNKVVSNDILWARVENENECFRTAQINLNVTTTEIPNSYLKHFYECDDAINGNSKDGISQFDFSSVQSDIEGMFPSGQELDINYYRNEVDALAENNPIAIAAISKYRNIGYPNNQNIYIRVDSKINNDCLGLGHHITLHVETMPIAHPVIIPEQCDDDGDSKYAFDTSTIETTLLGNQTGMTVSYTDENGNVLPIPLQNPFLTETQTITARVTNASSQDLDGQCFDETTIKFSVDAAAVANPIADIIKCDDDSDGKFPFNTSTIEATVLNGQTNMLVTYKDQKGNDLPSPLPNPFLSKSQTITARVGNPISNICYDETTFKLVVVEQPVLNMSDSWLICEGESVNIIADAGYDDYVWDTGETTSTITIQKAGTYTVTATNIYENVRCETTKTVTVIASNIATITNIETEDWTQYDNVIKIFVEGSGDYEYSVDGITYQDANIFENLRINNYTVHIRDKKGCGIATKEVFLMYYPKYFTPNNDGQHDTWHIYNSNLEPQNKIYIYDRYGKLIKELNPKSNGWDGVFKGAMLPTSDYWFVVNRQNGKQYKGHFTLKR